MLAARHALEITLQAQTTLPEKEALAGEPLCKQSQDSPDLEVCKIAQPPIKEFSGCPTVCISGVSPRTSFRNGTRTSRGQSRFNVSAAKRPLDAVLGSLSSRGTREGPPND